MAEYLPPVVARLIGDISDYSKKWSEAAAIQEAWAAKAGKSMQAATAGFQQAGEAAGQEFAQAAVAAAVESSQGAAAEAAAQIGNARAEFEEAGKQVSASIAAGAKEGAAEQEMTLREAWRLLGQKIAERVSTYFVEKGRFLSDKIGEGIRKGLDPIVAKVKPALIAAMDKLKSAVIDPAVEFGKRIGTAVADGVKRAGGAITEAFKKAIGGLKAEWAEFIQDLTATLQRGLGPLANGVKKIGSFLASKFEGEIGSLMKFIGRKSAENIGDGLKSGVGVLGKALDNFLSTAAGKAWGVVSGAFASLGKKAAASIGDGLKNAYGEISSKATNFAKKFGSTVQNALKGIFEKIPMFGSSIASALGSNPYITAAAAGFALQLAPVLAGAISSAITAAVGLGAGGLLLGIGAMVLKDNEKLVEQAKSSFSSIKDTMAEAAEPLVGPFIDGLKAVQRIISDLKPDFRELFAGIAPVVKMLTDGLGPMLKNILGGLKAGLPGIVAAFSGFSRALPGLGAAIGKLFSSILQNAPLIERLTKGLVDLVSWIIGHAGPAIHFFTVIWGAFTNTLHAMSTRWGELWSKIKKSFDGGTGALARISESWHKLRDAISATWKAVEEFAGASDDKTINQKFSALVQQIKQDWGPLKEFIGTVWNEAWDFVKRKWDEIVVPWWNGTVKPWLEQEVRGFMRELFQGMVGDVVSALTGLPAKAGAALSNLGPVVKGAILGAMGGAANWLTPSGQAIIDGLIRGIRAKFWELMGAMQRAAQIVRDYWPFSPAKRGPLSGRGAPEIAGRKIIENLSRGIRGASSTVEAAMAYAMVGAAPGYAGGPRIAPGSLMTGRNGVGPGAGQFVGVIPHMTVNLGGVQMMKIHGQLITTAQQYKLRTGTTGLT